MKREAKSPGGILTQKRNLFNKLVDKIFLRIANTLLAVVSAIIVAGICLDIGTAKLFRVPSTWDALTNNQDEEDGQGSTTS